MFGDALEQTTVDDIRMCPGIAKLHRAHPMLSASPPSNQQILDATKKFYGANQVLVDTTTTNTHSVSQNKSFVSSLNANTQAFQNKSMPIGAQNLTDNAVFDTSGGSDGGLFGPTLDHVKASQLFTTISVGVSAEVIVFVGGLGGLGCSFDIAKREGPRGYGYATAELGLKIAADINAQAAIFNRLPSNLNADIFGLTVTAAGGLAATFAMFYTSENGQLTILGYSIALGIGAGGGAAVFGGHLWNFG